MSRRDVLGAAAIGAAARFAPSATLAAPSDPDDARLPDGSDFPQWERTADFTHTYHVDQASPAADDHGPGDRARPFRTIGRAAELLQPGERVVIASGIYRECIQPLRGGTGSDRMIGYEAAPGATVCVRGSEVLTGGWTSQVLPAAPGTAGPGTTVWRHPLSASLFPDAYNPFALPSIMGSWSWLDPASVDMGPYLRRRGLVFVDGKPLEPMEQLAELAWPALPPAPDHARPARPVNGLPARRRGGPIMQEVGGSPGARFWTDPSGTAIYVRFESGTPADHLVEVTTRQHALLPMRSGLGYIRVHGLTFQHAGNAYPFPQFGMVSLAGGDHWILEANTLEWANGMGLSIGHDGDSADAPRAGAGIVVRGNAIRFCGVEGVGGMGTTDALIEDNLIEWCGWADAERGWEAAATKFHRATNMLYRRNVIRHIRHGNGAWWDVDNVNCRVTRNVFADIQTVSAAIHFEMSADRNAIDNNIIWQVRNAEPGTPGQRGCAGSGIFDNASSRLIIANNLIGRCDNAGIFAIVRADRGRPTADGNDVAGNIFADSQAAIVFLDADNRSDNNVFANMPAACLGLSQGDAATFGAEGWRHIAYMDLPSWRTAHGWDRGSRIADMLIDFDPATLRLTVTCRTPLPRAAAVTHADMLGRPTGPSRAPGPLADIDTGRSWTVDPRRRR